MKLSIYKRCGILFIFLLCVFVYTSNILPSTSFGEIYSGIINGAELNSYKGILSENIPIIEQTYDSGYNALNLENFWDILVERLTGFSFKKPERILYSKLPGFKEYIKDMNKPQRNDEEERKNKIDNSGISDSNEKEYPSPDTPPNANNNSEVRVSNLAKKDFNVREILKRRLPFEINKKKNKILIYHTHTSEDYSDKKDYGVVKVGKALAERLEQRYGFDVIHNGTINDKDYNSSYTKAFYTASNVLKGNKNIDLVLDIHRDAVGNGKNPLKITTRYKNKEYAQLMFVVGTNKMLAHPNWRDNFCVSIKLQKELSRLCPGIVRPIYLTDKRYNQHLTKGALIVEAGGNGSDIEAVYNSMEVLSEALNNVFT